METIKLNHLNSTFILNESQKRRSLELIKVKSLNPIRNILELQVLDEKNMPVFTQILQFSARNPERELNRKFVFYDHISVSLNNVKHEPFEAEVYFG